MILATTVEVAMYRAGNSIKAPNLIKNPMVIATILYLMVFITNTPYGLT